MLTLIVVLLVLFVGLPTLASLILGAIYLLGMFHLMHRFLKDGE